MKVEYPTDQRKREIYEVARAYEQYKRTKRMERKLKWIMRRAAFKLWLLKWFTA